MFPDYHQPGDEWDKLDYQNMAVITDAAAVAIAAVANRAQPPRWYTGAPYGAGTRLVARPARGKAGAAKKNRPAAKK
jgi:hypothetical protein